MLIAYVCFHSMNGVKNHFGELIDFIMISKRANALLIFYDSYFLFKNENCIYLIMSNIL